jgi:1-deoxy-D-xylulose-5-phosphate reductoisomerase
MVEFCDGSVIAQLGRPDMKTPIAYALSHPDRFVRQVEPLNPAEMGGLAFSPLNHRFMRAVRLGFEVIRRGGLTGAVLNSANEAAVEAFLAGKILFGRIVELVESALHRCPGGDVTLDSILNADRWAREYVHNLIEQKSKSPVK